MTVSEREYRDYVLPLEQTLERDLAKLTPWEADFARTVLKQMRAGRPVTVKQKAIARKLIQRVQQVPT